MFVKLRSRLEMTCSDNVDNGPAGLKLPLWLQKTLQFFWEHMMEWGGGESSQVVENRDKH